MDIYRIFTKAAALFFILSALIQFFIIVQIFSIDFSNILIGNESNIQTIEDYSGEIGYEYAAGLIFFGLSYFMASFWNPMAIQLGKVPISNLKKHILSIPIFIQIFIRICISAVVMSILIPFGFLIFIGWGILLTNFIADIINPLFTIFDKEIADLAFVISMVGLMIKKAIDSREKIARAISLEANKLYGKKLIDSFEKAIVFVSLIGFALILLLSGIHYYIALSAIQIFNVFNLSSLLSLIFGLAMAEGIVFIISWMNKMRIRKK